MATQSPKNAFLLNTAPKLTASAPVTENCDEFQLDFISKKMSILKVVLKNYFWFKFLLLCSSKSQK
jgi:hypothetical protein